MRFLFVIYYCILHLYAFAESHCENEDRKNTFLWSVRHPTGSSRGYLFGTIHVPYTEVWNEGGKTPYNLHTFLFSSRLYGQSVFNGFYEVIEANFRANLHPTRKLQVSDRVREAFSFSDTVLLEVNLRDESTIRRLIRCKNLRRRKTARSYLPSDLYERIEKLMVVFRNTLFAWAQRQNTHNGDAFKRADEIYASIAGDWHRKKPEWLLFLLYQMCENVFERASSPMLDLYLAQRAAEENKQIIAIETTEEQCNPVSSVSNEEIIFAIQYTVSYLEHVYSRDRIIQNKKSRSISELVHHYKCGTLEEEIFDDSKMGRTESREISEESKKADMIDQKLREDIIIRRNSRMAHRLKSTISATENKTIFSAIGTGHFFGNNSVLQHLRTMGFIIEEVTENDIILSPTKNDQKKKFTSLWKKGNERIDSNAITIELVSRSSDHFFNFCIVAIAIFHGVRIFM